MRIAATFLGISLAFLGGLLGCIVLISNPRDDVLQFYAIWGAVVCFAIFLGCAVASWMAFHEEGWS